MKIPINVITVILLLISITKLISCNSDKIITYMISIFLFFVFYSYSDKSILEIIINISKDLGNSSVLYGSTDSLSEFFLTKNISSMYFIALYSYFLFLKKYFSKSFSLFEFVLFVLLIGLFFSRQAYLSFFILTYIYFLYSNIKFKYKILLSIISIIIFLSIIFLIFDFHSANDGASQRLELWYYFFNNIKIDYLFGNGVIEMNNYLINTIGIDNYHMFFMNQIGTYGLIFFIAYNIFLIIIFFNAYKTSKFTIFLILAYFLNVLFQTHGYEFQNLFLLMISVSVINNNKGVSSVKYFNNNPNI